MKVILVVGTRPNFIKSAPIYKEMKNRGGFEILLVNTGQHYDENMSGIFLSELGLPDPKYNLEAGSSSHGVQTGRILIGMDEVLQTEQPDAVLVMGDTNTTLAGALAAYKMGIALGHIESGMREFIWRPEEINKKMADHCADFCFCPTITAVENLRREGIEDTNIFHTGDITYDVFLQETMNSEAPYDLLAKFNVEPDKFILMTLHRAETVDNPELLKPIINQLLNIDMPVIFSVHPRTSKRLQEFNLYPLLEGAEHIHLSEPMGYKAFTALMLCSQIVVTDSSGTLKDAFYSKKPCVVVDETSEYTELLDIGFTRLVGRNGSGIIAAINDFRNKPFVCDSFPLGRGDCSRQIVDILLQADLSRKI